MKKILDDFREWLSDNLRYFILGFAILLILVLLGLGFRFLTSIIQNRQQTVPPVNKEEQDDTDDADQKDPNGGESGTQETISGGKLEKDKYPDVNTLLDTYYKALSDKDVDSLEAVLDSLTPEDARAILESDYIESYSNVQVYTKQGLTEDSYVAFVCYDHKYKGYDTLLPGMSYLYVETDSEGVLYIRSEVTEEQMAHITQVLDAEDTQQLLQETQNAYEEAVQGDAQLKAYLSTLGVI